MGLSDQEAAARRIEDHGTQHNARGRDRQEAWFARQGRYAGCTTPRHPFSRLTAQSGTCLGGRSTNAARCTSHRSTLHRPTQRTAPAIAPHCLPRSATAPFAGQAASPTTTALYCPSRTNKQAPAYDRRGPSAAWHTHPPHRTGCVHEPHSALPSSIATLQNKVRRMTTPSAPKTSCH